MLKRLALTLAAASGLSAPAAFGQAAPLAPVEQVALAQDAFSTGLLARNAGALGSDLWRGADAQTLAALLKMAPARPASPSVGAMMRRVLLSGGDAPQGATAALGGAKLKALARAGFFDEARQIESLAAGAKDDPESVEALAIADILSNDTAAACARARRVTDRLDNNFWVRLRVVCYASSGELDAAELALGILRENGRLGETDEALLAPLASGGKLQAPVAPVDAVHFAALKAIGAPIGGDMLAVAEGGVVKALARDSIADWPARLSAARRAAAMGVMSGAELKPFYAAAPADAVGRYGAVRAMSAPELLRDRSGLIAAEIAAAPDAESLFALSVLYTDDIRDAEGAIFPASEAQSFALARLAVGDAVGAERWLAASAAEIARGVPDEQAMIFIGLVGVLGELDPAGAQRIAAAANITAEPPRQAAASAAPSASLAPVVAAAIDAAHRGSAGEAALAALAASDAAAKGDPVAAAVMAPALRAAGLPDIIRRRAVEAAIAAMYPEAVTPVSGEATAATPASAPEKLKPRLKPKRSA